MIRSIAPLLALALTLAAGPAAAQAQTAAPAASVAAVTVTIERLRVPSPALEGNLEGNDTIRDVWVVLPPSYARSPDRRYPVVYALHGFGGTPQGWFAADKLDQRISAAYAAGAREMIFVFPDAKSRHDGSMYSTSVTTGDFEGFITRDLVAHIDGRYRTLARRESRGIMGHSMGGYGAARLGMKNPDLYSSLYVMSGCCLSARTITPEAGRAIEAIRTVEEARAASFMVKGTLAVSAAWSPNPQKPPFYAELPTENGVIKPQVLAEWAANAPLAMVAANAANLKRYNAIAIDVGDKDGLIRDNTALHEAMDRFGVANSFEVYDGDHGNRVSSRFEAKVVPFFSNTLQF